MQIVNITREMAIDFAKTKPSDERFNYYDCNNCFFAQLIKSLNPTFKYLQVNIVDGDFIFQSEDFTYVVPHTIELCASDIKDRTFGNVLKALIALEN